MSLYCFAVEVPFLEKKARFYGRNTDDIIRTIGYYQRKEARGETTLGPISFTNTISLPQETIPKVEQGEFEFFIGRKRKERGAYQTLKIIPEFVVKVHLENVPEFDAFRRDSIRTVRGVLCKMYAKAHDLVFIPRDIAEATIRYDLEPYLGKLRREREEDLRRRGDDPDLARMVTESMGWDQFKS